VSEAAGVAFRGFATGVAVADYDADGDPDLLLTCWGPDLLYRNDGSGRFTEVGAATGLADPRWGVGAAWFDADRDGNLDLYVANYFAMDTERDPDCWNKVDCPYRELRVACGPRGMVAEADAFFRNRGDGTFEEAAAAAGFHDVEARYGLGVTAFDFDQDGDQDVYVANDSRGNFLFENDGAGHFEEVGDLLGAAVNRDGIAQAGMGIAVGDYDDDLDLDLFLTNFSHDYNTLYRNESGLEFLDVTRQSGMGEDVFFALSWGTALADFDNDGDLDLFVANGHVYPEADQRAPELRYRQRNHLYENRAGTFVDVSEAAGLHRQASSRGAAVGDVDGDGDLDLAVVQQNEVPSLWINGQETGHHFLLLSLEGRGSRRDALGARVLLRAGARAAYRELTSGHSFASQHDSRLHFGLGESSRIELLEIHWPDGETQTLEDLAADAWLHVRQGAEPEVRSP
jgi:hypothetical protein